MTTDDRIERGRVAFDRREWTVAHDLLTAADSDTPLGLDDLERAGLAAHLTGLDDVAVELGGRAHHLALQAGEVPRAARHAFWLGMMFMQRGDVARGGGWMGRAARLLDEGGIDAVETGYLAIPEGISKVEADPAAALVAFEVAATFAERFGDPDLAALSRVGRGRSLIGLGETARGVALLDDAMVAVTSDELSPVVVGIVYCAAIEAFEEIFDIRRAQGWTQAAIFEQVVHGGSPRRRESASWGSGHADPSGMCISGLHSRVGVRAGPAVAAPGMAQAGRSRSSGPT